MRTCLRQAAVPRLRHFASSVLLSAEQGLRELLAARAAPASASRLFVERDAPPGCALELLLPHSQARVSVHTGPAGQLSVEAESADSQTSVSALEASAGARGGLTLQDVPRGTAPQQLRVRAWVPERFVSVRVLTAGGAASVDRLTEADLWLDVRGDGRADLGALRCGNVRVRTRGGGVRAGSLAGERVAVATCGGALDADRLIGRRVALLTHGGRARAKALLAERLRVHTCGGDVEVHTLRVGQSTRVQTQGGALALHAVDGERGARVRVHTGGGRASMALESPTSAFAAVEVHSSGGDVSLALPPGWSAPLHCASGMVDGGAVRNAALPAPSDSDAAPGRKAARARNETPGDGAHQGAGVLVDAGEGAVRLRTRTWLEGALGQDRALSLTR